jgi:hypothetical protein
MDLLAKMTLSFLDELDRTLDSEGVLSSSLIEAADFLSVQRSNPLMDHDMLDCALWDLADAVLAWSRRPASVELVAAVRAARQVFRQFALT